MSDPAAHDINPALSRDGGGGGKDLYRAELVPLP